MDKAERQIDQLEAEVRQGFKRQETRLNAILVTLATSAILIAINVVVQFASGS